MHVLVISRAKTSIKDFFKSTVFPQRNVNFLFTVPVMFSLLAFHFSLSGWLVQLKW